MSFKSIDMQVVLQKTHDVGKIQQVQQQQILNENQHNAGQLRQQFKALESSVNKLDYLEKNNIKDGKGGNKQNSFSNRIKKENKSIEDDNLTEDIEPHLGNNLDLHI